jgi:beta-glucanase (GH16 family)
MNNSKTLFFSLAIATIMGCNSPEINMNSNTEEVIYIIQAENFKRSSEEQIDKSDIIELAKNQWLAYEINVLVGGRYKVEVLGSGENNSSLWIEDYYDNKDNRSYDITGKMIFNTTVPASLQEVSKHGTPLNTGVHNIKIHVLEGLVELDWIKFTLLEEYSNTPLVLEQNMKGEEWSLVWADEFDGVGLPDTSKWSYKVGNWGWGNNEPQYYTEFRTQNARQENGDLIITAIKDELGEQWTSARLTTQGVVSFLYGKIEFRAKVPVARGTWAAGWLLGADYRDELSWPYCGEIDVLECVGYEIDNETGNGLNHATCHTRAYYFKQDNQIGSEIQIENMNGEYHTYAIEWYPDVIYGLVDGERYYTYDKTANDLEWPFSNPQDIILNLAVGGNWGGAKGIDESWDSHAFIIDYVRVYELK